ncbi:MAG: hypothetical protein HQL84_15350 [Magnetococcales bacterium]|nr:hypothetical protein [Magnetococcales bacterium]MBF0151396.1 hypothetical protein [Magnetococcales bacterium]
MSEEILRWIHPPVRFFPSLLATFFVLYLFPMARIAQAADLSCPRSPPPVKINVRFEKPRPQYNNLLSREKIEAMMPRKEVGAHSVGLTKSELFWKVSTSFTTASRTDRSEACVYLSHLTLDYGFGSTPVYIDRRYTPGSCPYKTILQHEDGHVAILDREGRAIQNWLKQKLSAIAESLPPTVSRTPKVTQQHLLAQIEKQTNPLFNSLKNRLAAAHARLDAPRNLEKTQKQCAKW